MKALRAAQLKCSKSGNRINAGKSGNLINKQSMFGFSTINELGASEYAKNLTTWSAKISTPENLSLF